jgi:hypothetical protein
VKSACDLDKNLTGINLESKMANMLNGKFHDVADDK